MNRFISYEGLPIKSGGAHQLNKVPAEIYSSIADFASSFTDSDAPEYMTLYFIPTSLSFKLKLSLFVTLSKKFGWPALASNQIKGRGMAWEWYLSESQVNAATDFCKGSQNLILSVMWRFKFIDPVSRGVLKDQHRIPEIDERLHNSQIYARLSAKSSVSLWFIIPVDTSVNYTIDYINLLRNYFPVKLSDKHWKLWTQSKARNWIPRHLDINALPSAL